MISHDELLHTKREDILRIAAKYGAYNVRVESHKAVPTTFR